MGGKRQGVPEPLYGLIKELMELPFLEGFHLGGGTNLAIKYDHRVSVDIDLFSGDIAGIDRICEIHLELSKLYPESKLVINNRESEQFSWITGILQKEGHQVKLDVIQNLGLLQKVEIVDGIRLIGDMDIAPLKLESMANRGTRKDLYDLVLLSDRYGLDGIYQQYLTRKKAFQGTEHRNIFNKEGFEGANDLVDDLGRLINFNNAKDLSMGGNQIILTKNSPEIYRTFVNVARQWETKVRGLAEQTGLKITPQKNMPARRKDRGMGL